MNFNALGQGYKDCPEEDRITLINVI